MSALDIPLSLRLPKKTAKALEGAGILTVGDLLLVAPRRYYHWGRLTPLPRLRAPTWSPTVPDRACAWR